MMSSPLCHFYGMRLNRSVALRSSRSGAPASPFVSCVLAPYALLSQQPLFLPWGSEHHSVKLNHKFCRGRRESARLRMDGSETIYLRSSNGISTNVYVDVEARPYSMFLLGAFHTFAQLDEDEWEEQVKPSRVIAVFDLPGLRGMMAAGRLSLHRPGLQDRSCWACVHSDEPRDMWDAKLIGSCQQLYISCKDTTAMPICSSKPLQESK
ncbi:hypothetical protein EYF80_042226 [Liparis tanakae]|uniref:Uncharacterized protein n=1 Tax=Liparis tanakae TaxID=230148 RepID=A0A4Z2G482_9TELE|nr:hypothetical protein EYF80_042226 [Liparis tanakae]